MNNTRLRHLLILIAVSLGISAVCFFFGGVIAEVASASPIMGVTFKAGGALAGFIISFFLVLRAYHTMGAASLMLKVGITRHAGEFNRTNKKIKAKTTLMKYATGLKTEHDAEPIWEAGSLTVHLRGIEEDDFVKIVVTDGNGGSWESDYFSPLCPVITVK